MNVNASKPKSATALFGEAVKQGDQDQVAALLAANPQLVDASDENAIPMVRLALYYGHADLAEFLVDSGARLTFHDAAALGQTDTVAVILSDSGTQALDQFSGDGYTPLQLACFFGHDATALWLLERGANPNLTSQNTMQIQAIHAAAAARRTALVAALLEKGADPNAPQQDGFRPLHAAAQNGDLELARLLLNHGADASISNAQGQSPYDLAVAAGHGDVADLLKT